MAQPLSQSPSPAAADGQLVSLKVPPHSIEAEQSVLGGLLLDNGAWDRMGDAIAVDDFYRDDHRRIFRHIAKLIEQGRPADVVTVAESIESGEDKERAGGLAYLASLAQNTPSAHNIRRYAEIVRERAIMRQLVAVGNDIADSAFSPAGKEVGQLLEEAESKVFQIAETRTRAGGGFHDIHQLLSQVMERVDFLYSRDNPSDVTGVPTGYRDLDSMTSGLQEGDLVIVAGRPSMGKTAFALNIGEHVAVHEKRPVAVFSMEMSGTQLAARMLGSLAVAQKEVAGDQTHQDDPLDHARHARRLDLASRQDDPSGAVPQTDVLGDPLPLRMIIGMDAVTCVVEDDIATDRQLICRAVDAVIRAAGSVREDEVAFDQNPRAAMSHFLESAVDIAVHDVVRRSAAEARFAGPRDVVRSVSLRSGCLFTASRSFDHQAVDPDVPGTMQHDFSEKTEAGKDFPHRVTAEWTSADAYAKVVEFYHKAVVEKGWTIADTKTKKAGIEWQLTKGTSVGTVEVKDAAPVTVTPPVL